LERKVDEEAQKIKDTKRVEHEKWWKRKHPNQAKLEWF